MAKDFTPTPECDACGSTDVTWKAQRTDSAIFILIRCKRCGNEYTMRPKVTSRG